MHVQRSIGLLGTQDSYSRMCLHARVLEPLHAVSGDLLRWCGRSITTEEIPLYSHVL